MVYISVWNYKAKKRIKLVNRGDKSVHINLGDAFAQGIFMEYGITEDDRVETFRNGGFGSTDKNK